MKFSHPFEQVATFLVIIGAVGAGVAASYGRELEAKRQPDRGWWVRRLLLTPLLAIAATEATQLFGLTKTGAAFTAAMLSLGGYDIIRLLESQWRRRAGLVDDSP
jgi:hypothetical protein